MFRHRQLVTADPFSFTPAVSNIVNQQWLAELVWAGSRDLAGTTGVLFVQSGAIAISALAVWSIGRMIGASCRALVIASVLTAWILGGYFGVRAQSLAFPVAAVTLWALQRGGRAAWLAVPLTALWANLHGSFPLAIVFAGAFAAGSAVSRAPLRQVAAYLVITACVALTTLINPFGADVWRYVAEMNSNAALRTYLPEWAPTTIQTVPGKIFFAELAAGIAIIALRRPRVPPVWAALAGGLAVFTLASSRNIPWFGLLSTPLWALILDRSFPLFADHATNRRTVILMLGVAVMALIATSSGGVVSRLSVGGRAPEDRESSLRDLTEYLIEHPASRLYNEADWGAYLEANIAPAQVFIDTRFEVHPLSLWNDYYAVATARFDWQSILTQYGVERIAIDPTRDRDLERALEASGDWSIEWMTNHGSSQIVVWRQVPRPLDK
jgi:hypothetical protein